VGRDVYGDWSCEEEREENVWEGGLFAWKGWGDVQVLVHYGIASMELGTLLADVPLEEAYWRLCTKGDIKMKITHIMTSSDLDGRLLSKNYTYKRLRISSTTCVVVAVPPKSGLNSFPSSRLPSTAA